MPLINSDKIDDSEFLEFTNLKEKHALSQNYIVAEGPRIVARLLNSNLKILKIITDQNQLDYLTNHKLISEDQIRKHNIYVFNKKTLSELVGFKIHQGILAAAERPKEILLHEINFPVLALNRISNSENVGGIIRSANAFGINNIIIDNETCDPYLRRCIRVSMGAAFDLKIVKVNSLMESLIKLRDEQLASITSLEICEKSKSIYELNEKIDKQVIVLGSEYDGVDRQILEISNQITHIPINRESINSLNVNVACGIFLSHMKYLTSCYY